MTHDACIAYEFAAFVGLDWAAATQDVCLQAASAAKRACRTLEHPPAAIEAWGSTLRLRFHGHPMAVCLERHHGPLVSAWRTDDFLVRFPLKPLTLAR